MIGDSSDVDYKSRYIVHTGAHVNASTYFYWENHCWQTSTMWKESKIETTIINMRLIVFGLFTSGPHAPLRALPCCSIGRFINQCVSVACSHGLAKPAFCRYRQENLVQIINLINFFYSYCRFFIQRHPLTIHHSQVLIPRTLIFSLGCCSCLRIFPKNHISLIQSWLNLDSLNCSLVEWLTVGEYPYLISNKHIYIVWF